MPTSRTSGSSPPPTASLVLDVNDFDETLPGPWEWDLKRLAASFEIAGRDRDFTPKQTRAAVLSTAREYREAMRGFAAMRNLDVWYARLDVDTVLADLAKVADRKQMKAARKERGEGRKEEQPQGLRSARPRGRRRAADHQRSAAAGPRPRARLRGSTPRARGADPRDARPLPREPQGRPPPPLRQLPVRRNGPQGGRGRQRRHPRLGGADDGPRRAGPALPAGQGGRGLGARALRRGERVRQPRRAGGRGPVADAGRRATSSSAGFRRSGWTARSETSTCASSGTASDRSRSRPCRRRGWRYTGGSAAGRWPEPMRAPATGSRSAPTSARARASTRRSPTSPSATPTRTSSTTARSPTRPSRVASRWRRTSTGAAASPRKRVQKHADRPGRASQGNSRAPQQAQKRLNETISFHSQSGNRCSNPVAVLTIGGAVCSRTADFPIAAMPPSATIVFAFAGSASAPPGTGG